MSIAHHALPRAVNTPPPLASWHCSSYRIPLGGKHNAFQLEHGFSLREAQLAINDYQPSQPKQALSDAPTYVVLGGISAHRWLFDDPGYSISQKKPGWWSNIAGPNKALDPTEIRLISLDFLGSGDSSKPATVDQLIVTPNDQAHALAHVLGALGIDCLDGIIGSSYGGHVALSFARLYPQRLNKALVLCAAHQTAVLTSAYRSIQRRIVREAHHNGVTESGLLIARQLAMLGFRSAAELQQRFHGQPEINQQQLQLPVEKYLHNRGHQWAKANCAAEFICLSQSCDLVQVEPGEISVPLYLAAAENDCIVPFSDVQTLAEQAPNTRRLQIIETLTGHDAFLTETEQVSCAIKHFIYPEQTALQPTVQQQVTTDTGAST